MHVPQCLSPWWWNSCAGDNANNRQSNSSLLTQEWDYQDVNVFTAESQEGSGIITLILLRSRIKVSLLMP